MKPFLIRHPAVSTSGRCMGQTDVSISDEGTKSLPFLIHEIARLRPALIVTSDLQRCRVLATAAGVHVGCPVEVDDRWREIDFGAWENRSWDEIHLADEAGFDQWARDFQHQTPPQGEPFSDFLARVRAALEALPRDRVVVVVTHAGVIRVVACLMNLIPMEQMFELKIPFGSIFECDGGGIGTFLGSEQVPAETARLGGTGPEVIRL